MVPVLSSVTSSVSSYQSSLYIYKLNCKNSENPISKFTIYNNTRYPWHGRCCDNPLIIHSSGCLRVDQEPHLRPHGRHRELERKGGRGRGGVRHPATQRRQRGSDQEDQEADQQSGEQGSEISRCRGETRAWERVTDWNKPSMGTYLGWEVSVH